MDEPLAIAPELLEILLVRELRKAGIELTIRRRRRVSTSEDGSFFRMDLDTRIPVEAAERRVLVRAVRHQQPLTEEAVQRLTEAAREEDVDGAAMIAVPGFDPAAVRRAGEEGVLLLDVVDGRTVFRDLGFSGGAGYPSWLPEHAARMVAVRPGGLVSATPVPTGDPSAVLAGLRLEPRSGG